MEDLFLSENHLVLSRIFLSLDGRSLKNARLVCRGWDAFIRDHIWGCTLYRDILQRNLDYSWRHCVPERTSFRCGGTVFDIASDSREIVISLENGDIEVWSRDAEDGEGHKKKRTIKSGCQHGLRLGLTPTLIIGGFFEQNVRAWHRLSGQLLQLHPLDSSVHGLTVRPGIEWEEEESEEEEEDGSGENERQSSRRRRHHSSHLQRRRRTLALASMVSGQVAVFECAKAKLEETDLIPPFGGGGGMAATRGGPNHTTCDGEWLLFGGSRRDLVLYDLDRRREVRRMRNRHRVWALRMRYPLAATSGVVAEGEEAEEDIDVGLREGSEDQEDMGSGGVLVWNLVAGQVVRKLRKKHVLTMAMDDRRLVVVRESDVLLLQPILEPEEESGGGGGRISRIALLPGEDEEGGGGSRKSSPDPPSPSNGNRTSMSGAVLAAERVTFQAGEPSRVVTLDYWMCRGDRRAPSSMDSSEERNSESGGGFTGKFVAAVAAAAASVAWALSERWWNGGVAA